jgi:MoxR-like ATPase
MTTQEHTVTTANMTRGLPAPFFVLATQSPVEMYGTYPLPEAELDRFFLKLHFKFPPVSELNEMAGLTTTSEHDRAQRSAAAPNSPAKAPTSCRRRRTAG